MTHPLPPLNALRAFEAAARHLSFTRAADELFVTQAAISHQIKGLEARLGLRLFRRQPRRLTLTAAGHRLLPVLSESFDRIGQAVSALQESARSALTVRSMTFFAARWLAPRLATFWQRHPGVNLQLHTTVRTAEFERGDADLEIRWGQRDFPGMTAELLLATELVPACSPRLLTGPRPLAAPADLRHHTLLHEDDYDGWTRWLAAAQVTGVRSHAGPVIDEDHVLLQAAMDGQGVALVRPALVQRELSSANLVLPFELGLRDYAYYLVYAPGSLERPLTKAFRDWIMAEASVAG